MANINEKLNLEYQASRAYKYAKNIIKGRYETGETIIAKSEQYSYEYAVFVLKGRFQLGENIILTSPFRAYLYAKNVINGRFKIAEPIISQDALSSTYYARDVVKQRFILDEKIIYSSDWKNYYQDLIKNLPPLQPIYCPFCNFENKNILEESNFCNNCNKYFIVEL